MGFLNVPEFRVFVFRQHYSRDYNDGKGDKKHNDGGDADAVHPRRRRRGMQLRIGASVRVSNTLSFEQPKGFGVGVHTLAQPGIDCVMGVDRPFERVVAVFGLYGCGKAFPVLGARVAGNEAR